MQCTREWNVHRFVYSQDPGGCDPRLVLVAVVLTASSGALQSCSEWYLDGFRPSVAGRFFSLIPCEGSVWYNGLVIFSLLF